MPVPVSPLVSVVGEEAVVYDDFGLVVLCILPTALFARGIIGVDIDFVKLTEQAVFLELLFGNTEIGSYWGWTFFVMLRFFIFIRKENSRFIGTGNGVVFLAVEVLVIPGIFIWIHF